MAAPDRLISEWIDIAASYLRTSNWIAAGQASGPLNGSVQSASNAILTFATQALPAIGSGTPSGAQYRLTEDVALMNFATVPGTTVQLVIPAPKAGIFGTGSTIVDPSGMLASAIITQAIGVLADLAGNAVTAYVSGSKGSRRTEQL
jgi:hypothetical protein